MQCVIEISYFFVREVHSMKNDVYFINARLYNLIKSFIFYFRFKVKIYH